MCRVNVIFFLFNVNFVVLALCGHVPELPVFLCGDATAGRGEKDSASLFVLASTHSVCSHRLSLCYQVTFVLF